MVKTFLIGLSVFLTTSALAVQAPGSFKVGLVLDKGGKSDKGFNSAAFEGINRAKDTLKISTETVEAASDQGHEPLLREFAKRKFDLVIALGQARAAAVKKVANEFPKVNFAIVDGDVRAPNVRSILFEEQEGSYLVGVIAALVSSSDTFGFIGGMDIPLLHRFEIGYEAGIKKIKPNAKLLKNYLGNTSQAWNDKAKGKSTALEQYSSGAEVIYAAAGASNLGIFDATEEKQKFAIGVSNQNWIKPGRILTSMRKRVDIAVYITCQDVFMGGFSAEVKKYGLANQGVDFVLDDYNEKILPDSLLAKVHQIKEDIIQQKIKVPDYKQK